MIWLKSFCYQRCLFSLMQMKRLFKDASLTFYGVSLPIGRRMSLRFMDFDKQVFFATQAFKGHETIVDKEIKQTRLYLGIVSSRFIDSRPGKDEESVRGGQKAQFT